MKLLTWMHRKFRQSSNETLKEPPHGQVLLDNHQFYQKPRNGNKTLRQVQRDFPVRKSYASLDVACLDDLEERPSSEFFDLFDGFLAIGTLGADKVISEPETPTFPISVDKLAERETEVTENELKLINDELEKVLGAEAKEDGWTDSSGRNSHVSNARSSHASTITLSGKPMEITDNTGNGTAICPLQEYLFGTAVELPEKPAVAKKEHRTSLGELFQRHKAEETFEAKYERGEKRVDKEGDKTTMNLMKKILKKKITHTSSRTSSVATRGTSESASAETKLRKILQIFHKKVHPENSSSTQKLDKPYKTGIKNIITCNGGYNKGGQMFPEEEIPAFPERMKMGHMRRSKSCSNHSELIIDGSDSNGSRECWIKTDADYLVLEL